MRKLYIPVILTFLLTACAGSVETRATNALGITCASIGVSLSEAATLYKQNKFGKDVAMIIQDIREKSEAFCSADSSVNPEEVVGKVRHLRDSLVSILARFK